MLTGGRPVDGSPVEKTSMERSEPKTVAERTAAPSPKLRVLIVEDETLVGIGLRNQLERLGHEVVGQAGRADEAVIYFRDRKPDIVLLDVRLNDDDGIRLAGELRAIRRVPMIIITAFSERALVDRAGAAGVFGYLIKPVSGETLAAQIEVATRRFREAEELLEKNRQLTQTLEDRKVVEKAKGIYMKRLALDEPEAHERLQHEAQKRRINIAELAKKIIESEELLGGG